MYKNVIRLDTEFTEYFAKELHYNGVKYKYEFLDSIYGGDQKGTFYFQTKKDYEIAKDLYDEMGIKETKINKINMKKLVFESLDQLFEAKKLADIKSTHAKVEKTKAKKESQSAVEKAEQAIKALEAQKKLAQKPGTRKQTVAQKKADIEAIQKKIDAWKKKLEAAKK